MPSRNCFMALLLVAFAITSASAITYHVPGDAPTIQAGIDSASYGDTVLVACGTYYEHDIVMKSGIALLSATGEAGCATIDAQQEWGQRVLYCENVDESTLVKGFTLTGGSNPSEPSEWTGAGVYCGDHSSPTFESCTIRDNEVGYGNGGGMFCTNHSSPTLTRVTFEGNSTAGAGKPVLGGGLYCEEASSPRLTDCVFAGNSAGSGGGMHCSSGSPVLERVIFDRNSAFGPGGMVCQGGTVTLTDVVFSRNNGLGGAAAFSGCSPTVTSCTFYGNHSYYGSLTCWEGASPVLEQTILAFHMGGPAIYCDDPSSQPVLECCDIFGNEGGDWLGCIEDQYGINGNISEDPLFCDPENGDLTLHVDSPCAPFSPPNEECDLIGAWRVACGITSTDGQETPRTAMRLAPSVPNPCSPSTRITYMIPVGTDTSPVLLRIHDLAGRVVRTLVRAPQPPGVYTATWDGTNQSGTPVAGGVYFYQLKVNEEIQTRRMTLVR